MGSHRPLTDDQRHSQKNIAESSLAWNGFRHRRKAWRSHALIQTRNQNQFCLNKLEFARTSTQLLDPGFFRAFKTMLTVEDFDAVQRILDECPSNIEGWPQLIAHVYLEVHDHKTTLEVLHGIRNRLNNYAENQTQVRSDALAVMELLKSNATDSAKFLSEHGVDAIDVVELAQQWFTTLFSLTSHAFCVRVIDVFLVEGTVALSAILFGILKVSQSLLMEALRSGETDSCFRLIASLPSICSQSALFEVFKVAYANVAIDYQHFDYIRGLSDWTVFIDSTKPIVPPLKPVLTDTPDTHASLSVDSFPPTALLSSSKYVDKSGRNLTSSSSADSIDELRLALELSSIQLKEKHEQNSNVIVSQQSALASPVQINELSKDKQHSTNHLSPGARIKFTDLGKFQAWPSLYCEGYLLKTRAIPEGTSIGLFGRRSTNVSYRTPIRRFFMLYGHFLVYSKTHTDKRPKREDAIYLRGCDVRHDQKSEFGQYAIVLLANERVFLLLIASESASFDLWMQVLHQAAAVY